MCKSYIRSAKKLFSDPSYKQYSISVDESKFGGENTMIAVVWCPEGIQLLSDVKSQSVGWLL